MKIQKKYTVFLIIALSVFLAALIVTAVVLGIRNMPFGFAREVSEPERAMRMQVVQSAEKWLGSKESDGSYMQILEIYNDHRPLAQGYLVQPEDNWCAAFASAIAIECELTDIIPTECSCQRQIDLFSKRGRWQEEDNYVPLPGDYIFYSLKHPSIGDSTAWSDHVGIVVGTKLGYIKVIEGNNDNQVTYRYIPINDPIIRGFGLPDYGSKVQ